MTCKRAVIVVALAATVWAAVACDPGATVTYVNETERRISVYLGEGTGPDDFEVAIEPLSMVEVGTIATEWRDVVVIRDEDGNVILRREITWNQLKEEDFLFVITSEAPSPTPVGGR